MPQCSVLENREKMESLAQISPHSTLSSKNFVWASANGSKATRSSSSFSFAFSFCYAQRSSLRGNSAIVAVKKEYKDINRRKKDDSHSFIPRPDEVTGPFPEAVLLKEKKVEDDGRLMPEFANAEERELFEALNLQLESDLNVDQIRHYEVVYLIHENYKEEVENVNTKIQEFLKEKKGKVWRFSDWGMRRLAYSIQKAKNAHYILMNFELEAKWINEFKSMLDRDERVIRHLVIKKDRAETEDCPPPPEFHTVYADEDWDDDDDDDDDEMDGEDLNDDDDDDESENDSNSLGCKKREALQVG